MKLHLTVYPIVDLELLKTEHTIVDTYQEADVVLYFSTEQYEHKAPRKEAVMFQVEPPLAAYRQMVYARSVCDQFLRVYTFNPDPDAGNQFILTTRPQVFPYRPRGRRHRKDTGILFRKWYYAGDRYQQWSAPDYKDGHCESVNLYPARTRLVEQLMANASLPHYVTGKDWKKEDTRDSEDWRTTKLDEMDMVAADFTLCLENSRFPNYVSEKIHDGFNSDRVVFYLGAPNIEELIPSDCFINLGAEPYWIPEQKQVNWELVAKRMQEMSQEEYDSILNKARRWKDSVLTMEAYRMERAALTRHLMAMLQTLK